MRGVTYKEDSGKPYIAVFSDGSIAIFKSGTSLSSAAEQQSENQGTEVTVEEAIAGYSVLVWDGEVYETGSGNDGYYSRSAVGIKADGTIVFLQADGTMAPRSVGYTKEEEAYMLLSLGCVAAIRLDEGGSSTFVSQREGEDDVTMRNTAAGGSERGVSETILVVSTAPSDGEFDHVNITPNSELYTPNSEVQLTATGMDYSGAQADSIPDSVIWALSEDSSDMGTIVTGEISGNQAMATFTSNGTCGTATINMIYNETIVGSTEIRIQEPDELSFTSDETNLNYGEESDLGLVAKYQDEEVNLKDGDIVWSITDESAGTFEGNIFIATTDTTVSASATVAATYGSLTANTIINIGKEPTIIMDGGDEDGWDYSNIGTTVTSFDGLAADAVATYHYSGRGGVVTGSVVSDTDEEYADIVRFGHNAIKLEFDWTGITGTDGACLGLGDSIEVTGSPTAIGVWVYIPDESTPIPWLRAQIATSTDGGNTWTNAYINFNNGTSSDSMQVGWQYLEADLTDYAGSLIRVNSGMLFRAMVTTGGTGWYTVDGTKLDKSALTGYLLIDNICFVYGSNNQDTTNPKVSSISLIDEDGTKNELESGSVVSSSDLVFYATYDDNEDTDAFSTGVESAYFYLDGTYYGTGDQDNLGSTLAVTMANGPHSVTFYLKDAYGNVTRETRYFTVEAEGSTLTNMSIQADSAPSIGSEWTLNLVSNNPTDIAQTSTTISISKIYEVSKVAFAEGVTGTYEYDSNKGTLTISITAVDSFVTDTTLATIYVTIPNTVTQGSAVIVQVTKGTYETVTDAEYWKGFSTALLSYTIGADYVLTTDTLVAGLPGTITVTADELPIANLSIYCNNELLGTTDENGQLVTSDLTATAGSYTLYAVDENGSQSYPVTVTVYTPAGEEDGTPYYVLTNATSDATSEKNISWMSNPVYSSDTALIRISTDSDLAGATVTEGNSTLVTYSSSGAVNRVNSVYVTGLSAGTTYYYQVGDGTTWSDVSFFTAAEAEDTQTDFYVIADIQEDDAISGMTRIADLLGESDYDFGVQLGDAVDNVRYYNQWETALGLFTLDGISGTDLLHVVGNHEADDDGNDSYAAKSIFNLEDDWYSVEYGDVYVAVLNYTQNTSKLAEFSEWLIEDAAATSCTWKILVSHVPVYYTNPTGGGATYLAALPDAIEEAGIDFYFAGNDHSYARTSPMTDGEVDEDDGVVYYICGSTGGKSYSVVNNDAFNFEIATIDFDSIYLSVSANSSQMTITAYNVDEDGNASVFDTYTKEQTYCENDEHDYIYDRETDELTCSKCAFRSTMAEELVSGFVTDKATGKLMYMVSGTPVTVCMHYGDDFYFADDEGLAYDGEYVIDGQTIVFEDGYFVNSTTASVRFAGRATETVDFILYTDGTFKLLGSGVVEFDRVWNSPYYLYRNYITNVIVDEDITELGKWSCYSFTKATSITFGDDSKITRIGQNAFSRWYALTEIALPDGVTYIGYDAFTDCTALISAYIPDAVSSIMTNAFSGCNNVTLSVGYSSYAKEFAIAHDISYIERDPSTIASGECGDDLTWTLTSDGILTISGTGSMNTYGTAPWYSYRNSITTVVVGAGVTKLTTNVFYNCTKLTTVTFEEGSNLTAIGGAVFKNCTALREITLPDGLLSISGNAFRFCNNLYVYLPESVISIDAAAFSSTSDITLSVGKDTYAMEYAITYGMTYVERDPVTVASGECGTDLVWTLTSDGVLNISGTGSMSTYSTAPWYSYRTSITTVVIGAGVTKLTTNAFYNCTKLATVTFEEGSKLTAIGGAVFKNCTALREITLPDGLLSISGNAFRFCNNLYVYLPESVISIDAAAFSSTSDITLSVGKDTYAMEYAITYGMTYVERDPVTVASGECGTDLVWTLTSDGVLNISGTGSMSTYSTAPWYSYRTSITTVVIGAGVTKLTTNAFYNCTKLATVTFEEGSKLTAIGGAVFKNCTALREITLPDGLLSISGNAFRFCNNLYVYLPESVTSIDAAAFSSTTDVTLYVYENSYAYQWAVSNGMGYTIVDADDEDDTTVMSAETINEIEEDMIVVTEEDTE